MTFSVNRNSVEKDGFALIPLTKEDAVAENFSSDSDLNDFFYNDCWRYQDDLLAVTYKFVLQDKKTEILALVSLSNDSLQFVSKSKKKKETSHRKNFIESFPAVKIGRLAVGSDYEGQGLGRYALDFIQNMLLTENRTGCRFVTVDAYLNAVPFYGKCGFSKNVTEDNETARTVSMYFNLKSSSR